MHRTWKAWFIMLQYKLLYKNITYWSLDGITGCKRAEMNILTADKGGAML